MKKQKEFRYGLKDFATDAAIIAIPRPRTQFSTVLRTLVILSNVLTPASPKTFSIAPRVHSNAAYPQ